MEPKEEKVIVITRKMAFITSLVAIILIGASLLTAWYLMKKTSTEKSEIKTTTTTTSNSTFTLTSDAGEDGGMLPKEYTCDGSSVSPQLTWSNPPSGTKEYAIMMTTLPVDGSTKWSWVLYNIPAGTTSLAKGTAGIGKVGAYLQSSPQIYHPPCSQGSGLNKYTLTIYALSETPALPTNQADVTGVVLTKAISNITLGSANINFSYQRNNN